MPKLQQLNASNNPELKNLDYLFVDSLNRDLKEIELEGTGINIHPVLSGHG